MERTERGTGRVGSGITVGIIAIVIEKVIEKMGEIKVEALEVVTATAGSTGPPSLEVTGQRKISSGEID